MGRPSEAKQSSTKETSEKQNLENDNKMGFSNPGMTVYSKFLQEPIFVILPKTGF